MPCPIQTIASVPETSRPVLEKLQQTFGLILNVAGYVWPTHRN
jgi:hypothetical protein